MNNSTRVVVNTVAQYTRTVINLCLSLYSTRLILSALGEDDYGIYTLIAGTVALLSFMVNALVVTTQRFLSFYFGRGDRERIKEIFCSSVVIHIVFGLVVALLVEGVGLFLFDGFFNIAPERIATARRVYHCVTVMLVLTFWAAPFRALLIAHENIVYISVVDVLDGVLKLVIALFVMAADGDKLMVYALLLCGIQLVNMLAFSVFDFWRYEECVVPRRRYFRLSYVKEISSFSGWTIYSVGCVTGRTHGFSIILNKFFSTAVNGAFGVALQVNGAVHNLATSIMNAMNPQIVKAEGAGQRERTLRLAAVESKFCFLIIGLVAIPCMVEMPALLHVWLGRVPEHAVLFCRFILLTCLVDQLTIGLGVVNQAIGNIRAYSLVINSIKLFTLVPIVVCLLFWRNLTMCMVIYVSFEFICAMSRLVFIRRTAGLSVADFARRVFLREVLPVASMVGVSLVVVALCHFSGRFLLTLALSAVVSIGVIYACGLCPDERTIVNNLFQKAKSKIKK